MIHNIVTDKNGDEHQAVKGTGYDNDCCICSLYVEDSNRCNAKTIAPCTTYEREDNTDAIYKRRIKIGDIKR
jgi:hypothetical protein